MMLGVVGQRCMSEREPELGLGVVAQVDAGAKRIAVEFPATREKRLYALGTSVLKRVQFGVGESITTRDGARLTVEAVESEGGLLVYAAAGRHVREDAISDVTSVASPPERFMAAQTDPNEVFDLRLRALQMRRHVRASEVRGFLGGRIDLIPHQFYILQEMARRGIPRVLLADEVGLGKTIEACLILQRLLAVGQAKRALIVVPESLTHQWFVELLRRFNLWFSIYDEGRCVALEESDPAQNPFLASQLVLCSLSFLAGTATHAEAEAAVPPNAPVEPDATGAGEPGRPPVPPRAQEQTAAPISRRDQALAAGWDIVVVDEAHHLVWTPERASPEYELVAALAERTPGLLLLTATPTQLGLPGHFARLRLLDPDRYNDLARFQEEAESFTVVAEIAGRIVDQKPLNERDHARLQRVFNRDPARLAQHLDLLAAGQPGAREALLRTLLDQHGTGRVMFRNTRAAMAGFPKRKFCPAPVPAGNNVALLARVVREMQAEEAGTDAGIRYAFRDDPRVGWLVGFLQQNKTAKVLLICKSQRKVAAIDAALQERLKVKSAQFHEGLALVQRDRNAAWFAEPDGAQLLLCSEIGSEGRNFQFAHHLVLFDLPLDPGLLEQRIGRLDRIGQTQTIRIHVPYLAGSAEECVVEWYHRGLDAFETLLHGGHDFEEAFKAELLGLASDFAGESADGRTRLDDLIRRTIAFRQELAARMKKGRDRLLELNSFNPPVAARVIERVREADADPSLRNFLLAVLDHFGVRIKDHEEGDLFLDPSHAYIEGFPSIPADGMLATFDRRRAIVREDIRFLSADHPLIGDVIDLLVDSPAGTTAFGALEADRPNLILEAVYVLESVADSRWHVDQFLAPTPVRVVTDLRGNDLTSDRDQASLAGYVEDADLHRFLERPGFNAGGLKSMLASATGIATERSRELTKRAAAKANEALSADWQRLVDLQKLNDHIRPQEVAFAAERRDRTCAAIEQARLRLDSLRLIVEGEMG
ncbi:MAG TPA: RNA polymerase-associated protein RapA [Opitutaceae bacterium]|nr:RNA polymerase-associated protein RapA [Opitutaceae bacterium]